MKAARDEEANGETGLGSPVRVCPKPCGGLKPQGLVRVWDHCVGSPPIQPKGLIKTMMELNVSLDFACYHCKQSVGVTLKCEGKGLAAGPWTVATVKVPCPTCHAVNLLYFEPSGTVHAVSPYRDPRQVPEPSLN